MADCTLTQEKAYRVMLRKFPDVMDVEQVCNILKVSQKTGYALLKDNKIQSIKVGRAYRIPKPYLLDFLGIASSRECG